MAQIIKRVNNVKIGGQKKKGKKWPYLLLLLLFLLFGSTVPVNKIPGVTHLLIALGMEDVVNRGPASLFRLLAESAGIVSKDATGFFVRNAGVYGGSGYGANSNLNSMLTSVQPVSYEDMTGDRLLNARLMRQQMLREGSKFSGVNSIISPMPDAGFLPSDYNLDPNAYNSLQNTIYDTELLLSQYDMGDPSESGFVKPMGNKKFFVNKDGPDVASKDIEDWGLGKAKGGKVDAFVDPKGNYRRGWVRIGDIRFNGNEPINQTGNAWVLSRAANRAKVYESKKLLARAAFDGSELPDDVILSKGDSNITLDQGAIASDKDDFMSQEDRINICRQARQAYEPQIKTLLDSINTAVQQLYNDNIHPQCGFWGCRGSSAWNASKNVVETLCESYNDAQKALAQACGLREKSGTGNCSVAQNIPLSDCWEFMTVKGTIIGCPDKVKDSKIDDMKKKLINEGLLKTE
ncbi:hypothetical protein AAIR98_001115 [Elusimicrobium simillimum]|uniref:hypothetical protein n=1 Tax=Elusimicrobium simillimum TaxID=3143438 RepID=UPI003C6F8868